MSDDEADPELLELLRQRLGLGRALATAAPPSTGVLKDAEFICDNSIDVAISPQGTKAAAETIWDLMQKKGFSTHSWSEHELHPKAKAEATVNFIFTMNLLNFSFWSELPTEERFTVEHKGRKWTGYWSLVAALNRALDEGHAITTPSFWTSAPDDELTHIFRSATAEPIPLLPQRLSILREAATVLAENFSGRPLTLVHSASHSAASLVNTLVTHFPNFRDTAVFHGRPVRLLKRAQILVADLWACFGGTSHGRFDDVRAALTMFADYRVPQMLHSLGVLWYSPRLEGMIRRKVMLDPGSREEVEIRGCSIWAVEMLRRQIVRVHPEAEVDCGGGGGGSGGAEVEAKVNGAEEEEKPNPKGENGPRPCTTALNAVLIDFFLYDTCKEREREGTDVDMLPHHRTRSIYY